MSALEVFHFDGHQVRTVQVDDEPWFVAADVAAVLGYRMASDMTRMLDTDEKGTQILQTPGGRQNVTVISEPGLYDAVLRSRVEGARRFKRWVKHEVLPSIRKTGRYDLAQRAAPYALPQNYAEALRELASTVEAKEQAEALVAELEAPAAAWEGLASAQGDYTVSDTAKILGRAGIGTGPRKLFDYLRDDAGWIFRRGGRWQAMQTAVNAGYVVERITGGYFDDLTGERKQGTPQIRVTPRGIERLLTLMSGNVAVLQAVTGQ